MKIEKKSKLFIAEFDISFENFLFISKPYYFKLILKVQNLMNHEWIFKTIKNSNDVEWETLKMKTEQRYSSKLLK